MCFTHLEEIFVNTESQRNFLFVSASFQVEIDEVWVVLLV